jgi:hypothetical protein
MTRNNRREPRETRTDPDNGFVPSEFVDRFYGPAGSCCAVPPDPIGQLHETSAHPLPGDFGVVAGTFE